MPHPDLRILQEHNALARLYYQGSPQLVPIRVRDDVRLDDLLAISAHKAAACANIEAFLQGGAYRHMQFWGARGTGKSSLVRALYHRYAAENLCILQLSNDDLSEIAYLLWLIAQTGKKFLVFIDDLSFPEYDSSYRALKAVLDGSLIGIADNILLAVTSNRRHFLAEKHQDENALHPDEDIEEHISLSERFGLRLSFHPLSQEAYLQAVAHWLARPLTESTRRAALQFALAAGSRSARVARQFAAHAQRNDD